MKARLYTRVSTYHQVEEGESLQAQLEALEKYAKEHGYDIVGTYTDEGISAKNIIERDGIKSLLNDCKSGDTVMFTKMDRLSRNLIDANTIVSKWNEMGVNFLAIQEPNLSVDCANNRLIFNVMLSVAQHEREVTSERIKAGNVYRRGVGLLTTGNVPYGYDNQNKRAIINDTKAKQVQDIFDYYISNRSVQATLKWFNKANNAKKSVTFISAILKNKSYLGNATFPPIIDKEKFDLVQELRSVSKGHSNRKTHNYIFATLCECGYCGYSVAGTMRKVKRVKLTSRTNFPRYRCNASTSNGTISCFSISESKLEAMVLEQLKADLEATQINEDFVKCDTKDVETEMAKLKEKEKRLKRLYVDGLIEYEELKEQLQDIHNTLENLSRNDSKAHSIHLEANALEIYKTFDSAQKNVFWKALIKRIKVYRDKVEIEYLNVDV